MRLQDKDEIRKGIRSIIMELAPRGGVSSGRNVRLVEDLEYHSLALLELGFALEDEFDLPEIDRAAAEKLRTIGAVEDFIVQLLDPQG